MRRITKFSLGAAVLAAGLLGLAGTSGAAWVEPVTGTGNPSCDDGFKIDPVATGTYNGVTIIVNNDKTFSYSTDGSLLINAVIVKGGPGYNLYSYPAPGPSSDEGLHAPVSKNGGYYGLSHICFTTSKKGEEPPK